MNKLINNVLISNGYDYLPPLDHNEIICVKDNILKRINILFEGLENKKISSLDEYLNNCENIHNQLTKKYRLFEPSVVEKIKEFKFFQTLKNIFPDITITNEEKFYNEEVYWRLVRPNITDVGPVHADSWFWNLGVGDTPNNKVRIKIWVLIQSSDTYSGLIYYPKSHLFSFNYLSKKVENKNKPIFSDSLDNYDHEHVNNKPGNVFIFNDRLLHGGIPCNNGIRLSFEFTFLTSRTNLIDNLKIN